MTLSFAPDAIETWPLARLQPYAKNAKAGRVSRAVLGLLGFMGEFYRGGRGGPRRLSSGRP